MKVLNELRLHISKKQNLLVIDLQGRTFNTNIAKVQAKDVIFCHLNYIEFVDWTSTNRFARFWYFRDIPHSSILKQAIEKAINKSPDHLKSSKLFEDEPTINKISLLGLCSHTKGNLVTSFHIHSFAVFHRG